MGWVASELSGADASVVAESVVDVAEAVLQSGASLVAVLGVGEPWFEAGEGLGVSVDGVVVVGDVDREGLDVSFGVDDLVAMAPAEEWPVEGSDGGFGGGKFGGVTVALGGGRCEAAAFAVYEARKHLQILLQLTEELADLGLLVQQGPECGGVEGAGPWPVGAGEFGLAGDGGLVDPASGDGVGEDVEGGVFAGGGDVGVVVVASPCEGHVDASDVGGLVEDEDGAVDGAALGGVACLGVAQLDMGGDVVDGEPDGACGSGGGDVAVAMQDGDCPLVAVADHVVPVSVEAPLVAAGHDLITDVQMLLADGQAPLGVELAVVDASLLGSSTQRTDGVVGAWIQPHRQQMEQRLARTIAIESTIITRKGCR